MAQSFIPMLLLGPTLLLAYASSRAEEAADASPLPGAPLASAADFHRPRPARRHPHKATF
jgi:hypothetical protein